MYDVETVGKESRGAGEEKYSSMKGLLWKYMESDTLRVWNVK